MNYWKNKQKGENIKYKPTLKIRIDIYFNKDNQRGKTEKITKMCTLFIESLSTGN